MQADLDQLPDTGRLTAIRNLLYALEWWFFGGFAVFVWWRWARDTMEEAAPEHGSLGRSVGSLDVGRLFTSYRVLALVVGVLLAFCSLVALPLKYLATEGSDLQTFGENASILWLVHGWVFIIYVVVTFLLARQAGLDDPVHRPGPGGRPDPAGDLLGRAVGGPADARRAPRAQRPNGPDPVTTAFVLGGGGVLGAVEVGMLRALFERGIQPDLVLGTSVGALNGAMVARDPSPAVIERLTELWLSTTTGKEVYGDRPLRTVRRAMSTGTHIYSASPMRRRLVEEFGDATFEDLPVRFQVCAASIERAAEHWFHTGPLVDAIVASAAVPGLLPPARVGDEHFLDGGIVNSIPVDRAVKLGADLIYVLQVGRIDRPLSVPKRPWEVARVSFEIARRHRFAREMADLPEGVVAHVLPARGTSSRDDSLRGHRDFASVTHRIQATYEASLAYLDDQPNDQPNDQPMTSRMTSRATSREALVRPPGAPARDRPGDHRGDRPDRRDPPAVGGRRRRPVTAAARPLAAAAPVLGADPLPGRGEPPAGRPVRAVAVVGLRLAGAHAVLPGHPLRPGPGRAVDLLPRGPAGAQPDDRHRGRRPRTPFPASRCSCAAGTPGRATRSS